MSVKRPDRSRIRPIERCLYLAGYSTPRICRILRVLGLARLTPPTVAKDLRHEGVQVARPGRYRRRRHCPTCRGRRHGPRPCPLTRVAP